MQNQTQTTCIDHPSGYLALSARNSFFPPADSHVLPSASVNCAPVSDGAGFISYRRQGRHLFLFGGVHAPIDQQAGLLDAFLRHAAAQRCAVVAVQLRATQLALFAERGFVINRLGTSFGVRLDRFSLAGTRRMKLRNKIARARRLGLRVLEVGRDLPRSVETYDALQAISGHWLRRKGKKELDFMIGELGLPEDRRRRIFVVTGPSSSGDQDHHLGPAHSPDRGPDPHRTDCDTLGRNDCDTSGRNELPHTWIGFITYVPVYGQQPGYLHDLTRRLPDAPPGAMELCNAEAMSRLHAEGCTHLHFGFTPFVVDARDALPASIHSSRLLEKAVHLLYRHGRLIYPAQSQADYKRKWGPDLIEPEYVAARPLSLRAIWDLLRLTRSL